MAATVLAASTLILVSGAVAQAHVQVIPDQTAAGSEITVLTFRVPTESAKAGTSQVSISLPTDTPLASVLAEPVAGWSVSIKTAKLPKPFNLDGTTLTEAPSSVTWTAAKGHAVMPGGFQEFKLSAGPIPNNATVLSFPTTQTYTDGTVVKWNQPQPPGADEPEHPLPSFKVTAAVPDDDAPAATPSTPATPGTASLTQASGAQTKVKVDTSDSVGRGLGAAGLVAGLLGLAFGLLAWRRASTATSTTGTRS